MKKYNSLILFLMVILALPATIQAQQRELRLSLDEVSRLALTNNFEIQLAKFDAWIAQTDEQGVQSIYDTMLDAEIYYRNDQSKNSSTIQGAKTQENEYNIGLKKKLPTGTTVGLGLDNFRQSTNSSFVTNSPVHDSTLDISVEQELGKNFFGIQDRGTVKLTLIDIENAEYTSLDDIERSVADVQKAYWELVLQEERVSIESEMVEQAKRFFDLQQEKLKDGLTELPDAIAAEANYEQRKNNLLLLNNGFKRQSNVLKLLLNQTEVDGDIQPKEEFELGSLEIDLNQNLKEAFEYRRDYKKANNQIEQSEIQLVLKKNNLWPEINLTASLEKNGLGDDFNESVTNITSESNPNWFAGLTFSFPLENREARADFKAAELDNARKILDLKYLEKQITVSIVNKVRDCNIFLEAALNEENVAKLQAQKFQEDMIQARLLAAQAKYEYYIALVELEALKATLLTKYWNESL